MYRAAGMWDQALRVAQAYAPDRVGQLQRESRQAAAAAPAAAAPAAGGGNGRLAAVLARAQAHEQDNDPARAIEVLLAATVEDGDVDGLQQVRLRAGGVGSSWMERGFGGRAQASRGVWRAGGSGGRAAAQGGLAGRRVWWAGCRLSAA
jgi:hypothetical protein